MNLIDTNAVSNLLEQGVDLDDDFYLAPDVQDEAEVTELEHERKMSTRFKKMSKNKWFNESRYLYNYHRMLNTHGDKSFYNMTGFGDISILATVHTLLQSFQNDKTKFFPYTEMIYVFTEDRRLINKISKEFKVDEVQIGDLNTIGSSSRVTFLNH